MQCINNLQRSTILKYVVKKKKDVQLVSPCQKKMYKCLSNKVGFPERFIILIIVEQPP